MVGLTKDLFSLRKMQKDEKRKDRKKSKEDKNKDKLSLLLTIIVVILILVLLWFITFTNKFVRELTVENTLLSWLFK